MVMRDDWARLFLERCGWPTTHENMVALIAWQAAEGGPQNPPQAKYNPLNTTLYWPGSTIFNYVNVRNYHTLYDGLDATKRTIKQTRSAGYGPIRRAFRSGKSAERVLDAVEASAWGTGGLARRIIPNVRDDWQGSRNVYWNLPIGQ